MSARKQRIAEAFSAQAAAYDDVAPVQRHVARELAGRVGATLPRLPERILEIGCGTGLLSAELARMFPESDLLLTDLSPAMLDRCRARLGDRHRYQPLDGENPENLAEKFNLIASSLAFQWFADLGAGLERLSHLLAPGGRLIFATLGSQTFIEWRRAHAGFGLPCGTPDYQTLKDFPWPTGFVHTLDEAFMTQHYANGMEFARSLKTLGAGEPAAGHQPLPPGIFRRLLASLDNGFSATYHLIYGEIIG